VTRDTLANGRECIAREFLEYVVQSMNCSLRKRPSQRRGGERHAFDLGHVEEECRATGHGLCENRCGAGYEGGHTEQITSHYQCDGIIRASATS
jgi:hypothetical protein